MNRPLTLAFLLAHALTVGCDHSNPAPVDAGVDTAVDAEPNPFDHPARVLRVIDGDTVEVDFGGVELTVRFSGIDTPELGPPVEPWADEARLLTLQNATPATTVGLEFDDEACATAPFPAGCFDVFDRMLAYVRTSDGQDLNAMLLSGGLATVYEQADFERKPDYLAIQAEAQAQQVGLWSQ